MVLQVVIDEVETSIHCKEILCSELDILYSSLLLVCIRGNERRFGYINPNSMEPQLSGDNDRVVALVITNPVVPYGSKSVSRPETDHAASRDECCALSWEVHTCGGEYIPKWRLGASGVPRS